MKKLIVSVLLVVTLGAAYAQTGSLVTVNTVKPRAGQKMAWEAAWKAHVAKFHTTTGKTNVYEIISGPSAGFYHIVGPAGTYADLDKTRPDAEAHGIDLEKTTPLINETTQGIYTSVDSLGIRPNAPAESFAVLVRHLTFGVDMPAVRKELSRGVKIRMAQKLPMWENFSSTYFEQLWDGSDQVTVSIRNLKDGFKSLAPDFYPAEPSGAFREAYTKAYGGEAWDARVKLLDNGTARIDQYLMVLRKDLSSK
jgi:hypothetical protein